MLGKMLKKIKYKLSINKSSDGFFRRKKDNLTIYSKQYNLLKNGGFYKILESETYAFSADTKNPTIIDCGANIGLGILYWKSVYPKAKITAFEPSREVYESLCKNVKENNLSDVICINSALSDTDGEITFKGNEHISGTIRSEKITKGFDSYSVKMEKLSPYLDDEIDLLKIDIEGAEKFVLPEIEHKLKNVKNLFLEFHSFTKEMPYLSSILQILERQNMRYYIEDEFKNKSPFINRKNSLGQDYQLNIWAYRTNRVD